MTTKNLFNLVGWEKSYEQTRKSRHGLDSVVSRFSLGSLICILMLTIGIGNAWGATVTYSNSDFSGGSSGSNSTLTVTQHSPISVSAVGYKASAHVRFYSGGEMTISGATITQVVFTCTSNDYATALAGFTFSTGSCSPSSNTATWTGSTTSLKITSNAQTRYSQFVVTYTAAASHTLSSAVSPVGGGTVALSATSVTEGSTATATATPAAHYTFTSWSISGTGASLSSTTTNPTTITMGSANATVTATFTAVPKASITLSEAGSTTTDATTYYVGDTYTLPTSTSASCGTKVLVGWSTVEVATTDTKPTSNFYEKGEEVTLAASQTFYAVFATSSGGGSVEWVDTNIEDLTSSDIFVIATPGGYAVSNNNGTGSAPTATAITVSNGKITSSVTDAIKWNIGGDGDDGYIFYPNGTTSTWLYCSTTANSGSNNNIRVGTGNRKYWIPDNEGDIVTNDTYTDRWLCNYNDVDFRGYVGSSVTSDIVSKFYKYHNSTTYSAYTTSCCTPLGTINGSFLLT